MSRKLILLALSLVFAATALADTQTQGANSAGHTVATPKKPPNPCKSPNPPRSCARPRPPH